MHKFMSQRTDIEINYKNEKGLKIKALDKLFELQIISSHSSEFVL